MSAAARAFAAGLWTVVRAPGALAMAVLVTVATVLPFAVVLGGQLQSALAHQPPIDLNAEEIDAEWWREYRTHASGLASTFTPAIIGFAAPLENLSALLDGSPRPWAIAAPVVLHALAWALLWGALLHRFRVGRRVTVRDAAAAGMHHFLPFALISALAGVVILTLFWTVHGWLFGPVYDFISARADGESTAFAGRVVLYVLFGALLASVSLIADYARVALVVHKTRSVRDGFAAAAHFMRAHSAAVVTLFVLSAGVFAAAFIVYGVADQRFGGWRAVLLGQAFIVGRLALRLVTAASQLTLYDRLKTSS